MPTVLAEVEWEACPLEPHRDAELESYVRRTYGALPSSVAYFTPVPWLVRSMPALSVVGAPPLHFDTVLADLIGLVVSQDNSCRYCFGMQRLLLRVRGIPEAHIRELEQNYLEAEIDPRTKAALDFARRLSRAAPRVGALDLAEVRDAGWSPDAIRELAFQSAYCVYMNRLMTISAIPFARAERLATSRLVRWFAPLWRWRLQRRLQTSRESALLSDGGADDAPWSSLVKALSGTNCARPLRETLDAAFASPVLSRRAKALIFAVVARGLDCRLSEREALGVLSETGLDAGEIESILTHLASPRLDEFESALLPFARGTIRGSPAQLQQRTPALAAKYGEARTVEAIGIAALANAVCRLGAVTELG